MHTRAQLRSVLLFATLLTLPAFLHASKQAGGGDRELSLPPSSAAPASFDLRTAGFERLSNPAMLSNGTYLSIAFVDEDHLLITFKKPGLVKRMRTCPVSHADHLVRALIYELSSAKVISEAEWYLHDMRRYLWPLGGGRFLLRKADQLYVLDRELHERLLFDSPRELTWVDVTPDGKQIILETRNEPPTSSPDKTSSREKASASFQVSFRDVSTVAVQREIQAHDSMRLQGTSTGYPDLVRASTGNLWLVRFGPDSKTRRYVARVRSLCTPTVLFPTANTMFIGRCSSLHAYSVSMFTVTGTRLWRQRWVHLRDVPSISRSDDGSRFAISTVHSVPRTARTTASDDPQEDVAQTVDVFDTASGNPVLSVNLSPTFIAGQNFSLSPDGTQLAVVRGSRIEFVSFAPQPPEERAKYLAVKADVPGLYAPSEQEDEEPAEADELALAPSESENTAGADEQASTVPDTTGDASSAPTFKASSKVVVVEVVVLDGKNRPVQGLTRDHFIVKEDGVPQRIRYFEDNRTLENKTNATAPVRRPQNVFSNAGENVGTSVVSVILYDTLNTPPSQQAYALQQLTQYLQSKPPDVRAALFTLTTNLRMITGFTEDQSALLAAVQGKKEKVSGSIVGRQDAGPVGYDRIVASLREQFAQSDKSGSLAEMLKEHQQHQDEQDQATMDARVQITLDAFVQLARYLSGIPGRKNLIWLSSSFPIWISPNPDSNHPFNLTRTYGDQIKKAVNMFAQSHVAVYPVNLRGLAVASAFDVSAAGNGGSEDFGDPDSATSDRATMRQIADATGGRAFVNTNGIKDAIQESVEQSSAFYTLSYTPTNGKYDGKFRNIRVETSQRGYRLQYRTGYYAEESETARNNPEEQARELQLAALQPGAPSLRQIPFIARVVPVAGAFQADAAQFISPAERKRAKAKKSEPTTTTAQHFAVDYAIPASRLRFVPMPDGSLHGVFNFMLTAFDRSGSVVARAGNAANSDLPSERYKELLAAGYRMHQEIDVPASATALRLAVQDVTSGKLGTLEIALPVPPPPDLPQRKGKKALPEVEPD